MEAMEKLQARNKLLLLAAFALRIANPMSWLQRTSFPDHVQIYEKLSGNSTVLVKYPIIYYIFLRIVPSCGFSLFIALCDLLTAVLQGDAGYFFLSSLLPANLESLENLCLSLFLLLKRERKKKMSGACGGLLLLMNHHFFPIVAEGPNIRDTFLLFAKLALNYESLFRECHLPSVGALWYLHMHMFEQYQRLHFDIVNCSFLFLSLMQLFTHIPASSKVFLSLFFRRAGHKNYLLLLCILRKEFVKRELDLRAFSLCRNASIFFFLLDTYVWVLINYYGIGNFNFLCWFSSFFQVSVMIGVLHIFMTECKKGKARPKAAESGGSRDEGRDSK